MLRHFGSNSARGNFEVLGGLDCFDPRLRIDRDHFERGPGDTAGFLREPKGHPRIGVWVDDKQPATRGVPFGSGIRPSQWRAISSRRAIQTSSFARIVDK